MNAHTSQVKAPSHECCPSHALLHNPPTPRQTVAPPHAISQQTHATTRRPPHEASNTLTDDAAATAAREASCSGSAAAD